ncbi:MAG: nicotinate-nucleotide--dimethylbenzimidazole phosphoribosyltransferase [Acidobacteriota bacterium]|nr:nicotinate-nucleotide--dimethylbenzimidazole phosphoribosyltransferase [Acidobacteriota bacterium]MDE3082378.1 nicotinate-nucleotide--dimethylbenzimidazole phosphoribosyltransferase [Acidobacteriota bacterium]
MEENLFDEQVRRVVSVDEGAAAAAVERQGRLTKPAGSLGELELLGAQLSAIAGQCPPPVPEPAMIGVFAGDHGVTRSGVTPWPSEVTAQMVANFCAGGAAINVLARHVGAGVTVVDVGVATPVPGDAIGLVRRNVAAGTADMAEGPAMTHEQARAALAVGAEVALESVRAGARLLATGDMGIGNTTPSAALIAAFTGATAIEVTGRGTGIDDAMLRRKTDVVGRALQRVGVDAAPLDVLAEVGGLEIAALAGFIVAGAASRVPVVIDGVIAVAAAVVADAFAPAVSGYLIGGHRSSEPAASLGLAHLGITPLLDLGLRLGEGSGAALAIPVVQAAAKILREMATFESAGVSERDPEG